MRITYPAEDMLKMSVLSFRFLALQTSAGIMIFRDRLEKKKTRSRLPLTYFRQMADVLNHPTPFRAPFYHSPLGYYGNSRNIVVSDSPVYRFAGVTARQFQTDGPAESGASKKFDFELELGVYLARPSKIGQRIKLEEVDDYVFGFVLLNDWSGELPTLSSQSYYSPHRTQF